MQTSCDNFTAEELAKIKWNCRRGGLELDLLLNNFYSNVFPSLEHTRQLDFIEFLSVDDGTLQSWLFGDTKPSDKKFLWLITKMKSDARSSSC